MNVVIRRATVDDAQVITRYNSLMAQETESKLLDRKRLTQGVNAILKDTSKGMYFVAEVDGTVVGQLMVTYEWSDWRNGNFWWIQSVYVEREYRGKGVFKSLYDHVLSLARRQKDSCGLRLYVEKHNRRARKIYEDLGMKETDYLLYEIDFVFKRMSRE
jgi:ribosomal protein S18 acetylase RimI-like enzyme